MDANECVACKRWRIRSQVNDLGYNRWCEIVMMGSHGNSRVTLTSMAVR